MNREKGKSDIRITFNSDMNNIEVTELVIDRVLSVIYLLPTYYLFVYLFICLV